MAATTCYKKLDLFKTKEHWDSITTSEYVQCNRRTEYTPNKPKCHLKDITNNVFIQSIGIIFKSLMGEWTLRYRNATYDSHFLDSQLIQYCWTFIRKADTDLYKYFKKKAKSK